MIQNSETHIFNILSQMVTKKLPQMSNNIYNMQCGHQNSN